MNKKQVKAVLKTLDSTDELIIAYLKEGLNQAEISKIFEKMKIKPNSLSIIEKRLKVIREKFGAKTNFHLATIISIV